MTWLTVADANGDAQTLNVGTLAAGASNFPDSDQNSPPASASVQWYLPPIPVGETVDHYCLKATVTSTNDVNPHNNWVQSNIAFAEFTPPVPFRMAFLAGNPGKEEIEVRLQHTHTLPDGWAVKIEGLKRGMRLKPGRSHPLVVVIAARSGADATLEPPYDGQVIGKITGSLVGTFEGTLTQVNVRENGIEGVLAGTLLDVGSINGSFSGTLDRSTGELSGTVTAAFQCAGTAMSHSACLRLDGCLRPNRRVDIAQLVDDLPIGGVTVQVQVPMPKGACAIESPANDHNRSPQAAPAGNESEVKETTVNATCRTAPRRSRPCSIPAGRFPARLASRSGSSLERGPRRLRSRRAATCRRSACGTRRGGRRH